MRLAVTTPASAGASEIAAARAAAGRRGLEFVERGREPLEAVAARHAADALLVVGSRRVSLWLEGTEHRWTAGMGALRVKRLLEGERPAPAARGAPGTGDAPPQTRDLFLEAAGLRPGDEVLDATLGLGMDALVASAVVGPAGRVVGIERSPALAALTAEGLAQHASEAARRIEVLAADADDVLSRLPARSFDVVVFDPMFRRPRRQPPGFELLRRLGDPRPLAAVTLARARLVARRWVVVKDGAPGRDLARLGITPLPASRWSERLYARVPSA